MLLYRFFPANNGCVRVLFSSILFVYFRQRGPCETVKERSTDGQTELSNERQTQVVGLVWKGKKRCYEEFYFNLKMHQKAFGGRTLRRPAEELRAFPIYF